MTTILYSCGSIQGLRPIFNQREAYLFSLLHLGCPSTEGYLSGSSPQRQGLPGSHEATTAEGAGSRDYKVSGVAWRDLAFALYSCLGLVDHIP